MKFTILFALLPLLVSAAPTLEPQASQLGPSISHVQANEQALDTWAQHRAANIKNGLNPNNLDAPVAAIEADAGNHFHTKRGEEIGTHHFVERAIKETYYVDLFDKNYMWVNVQDTVTGVSKWEHRLMLTSGGPTYSSAAPTSTAKSSASSAKSSASASISKAASSSASKPVAVSASASVKVSVGLGAASSIKSVISSAVSKAASSSASVKPAVVSASASVKVSVGLGAASSVKSVISSAVSKAASSSAAAKPVVSVSAAVSVGSSKAAASSASSKAVVSSASKAAVSSSTSKAAIVSTSAVSKPAASSTSSAATVSATGGVSAADQAQFLTLHNNFRAKYSAGQVTWDDSLASFALKTAQTCKYGHTGGPNGENIAAGVGGGYNIEKAFGSWANEDALYSFTNPGYSAATGHFTQIVWKGTTKIGCAAATCSDGTIFTGYKANSTYVVCEYQTPGNVVSSNADRTAQLFTANVGPKV